MTSVRVLDLSMVLNSQTPVYPGDPPSLFASLSTVEKQGWNEQRVTFNSHFGTHIDAPFHMRANGKKLDDFPIESFIGFAVVLDARNQNFIDVNLDAVRKGDFVFLCTNHTQKAQSPDFFKTNPVLSPAFAQKLIDKRISMLGLDSFSPDNPPFEIHHLLFEHDIRIVENLVHLEPLIGKRFECFILPLKLENADGAPCRVVARLFD